jgi:hypothetical protein
MNQQIATDIGRLVLDGNRTIRSAELTYAQLSEMTARHAVVEIDCGAAQDADLSLVQLILAARMSAQRAGKTVVLARPASGALLDVLQRGGFLSAVTDKATADQAFWLQPARV